MNVIKLNDSDNIALASIETVVNSGEIITDGVEVNEFIPFGNKVSLKEIKAGEGVYKSGYLISYALHDISSGSLVNERNTIHVEPVGLDSLNYTPVKFNSASNKKLSRTFWGFRNDDGTVGTRNYLCVTTTVQCVAGVLERACEIANREYMDDYKNVDGIVPAIHAYGCGVAINATDAHVPIKTINNIAKNPNFGGRKLVIGLGCEKLTQKHLDLGNYRYLKLQDTEVNNFSTLLDTIGDAIRNELAYLNHRKRVECDISELKVAMQCGGSDGFSGLTANPLLGRFSDLLVSSGATTIFSEITEVRDAIELVAGKCANERVHSKLISGLKWYDNYLEKGGADSKANTTPGNKAGGLSNIREKALGSIMKSGLAQINDVIYPGDTARSKGLNFLAGPSSDFVCGTLYLAAGANLQLFTTGRGTPYNLKGLPTIKLSSNSQLANNWNEIIDFDAGKLISEKCGFDLLVDELLDLVIRVASGQETKAEKNQIFNNLTLFNPAPIT